VKEWLSFNFFSTLKKENSHRKSFLQNSLHLHIVFPAETTKAQPLLFIPEAKMPIMRPYIVLVPETVILFLFYKWKRGYWFPESLIFHQKYNRKGTSKFPDFGWHRLVRPTAPLRPAIIWFIHRNPINHSHTVQSPNPETCLTPIESGSLLKSISEDCILKYSEPLFIS
jgi:hypothetical protein